MAVAPVDSDFATAGVGSAVGEIRVESWSQLQEALYVDSQIPALGSGSSGATDPAASIVAIHSLPAKESEREGR